MEKTTTNQTFLFPAIFSFFIPGAGQLIKKQWYRAGTFWALAVVGLILCAMLSMPVIFMQAIVLILWIWQVYDTYTSKADWK
jgi:TM2 domain-containing membrane protein YozV